MMDKISFINILFDPTESTIEFAAITLHNKIKSLDPGPEEITWLSLSDQERDFYRLSVKAVLKSVADVYVKAFTKAFPEVTS